MRKGICLGDCSKGKELKLEMFSDKKIPYPITVGVPGKGKGFNIKLDKRLVNEEG